MKRAARTALGDETDGDATKRLATQLRQLQLSTPAEHTYDETGYMQDVQARGFAVVDSLDDGETEIEIAPAFLRIPRAIIDESQKRFYERESQALIPYRPPDQTESSAGMDLS